MESMLLFNNKKKAFNNDPVEHEYHADQDLSDQIQNAFSLLWHSGNIHAHE
jgi:hypothetical protein